VCLTSSGRELTIEGTAIADDWSVGALLAVRAVRLRLQASSNLCQSLEIEQGAYF